MLILRQLALKMPRDITQNMGIHGSITGKMMTCISCFDYSITIATPSSETLIDEEMKRTSYKLLLQYKL